MDNSTQRRRTSKIDEPTLIMAMAEPYDSTVQMINRRHKQLAKGCPGIQKEIENDKQEAENIAKIIVERDSNIKLNRDDVFEQIMRQKLAFLDNPRAKTGKLRPKSTLRRKVRQNKENVQTARDSPTRPYNLRQYPYHYSRFQKNLHTYNLEYDVTERHVRETHHSPDTKQTQPTNISPSKRTTHPRT